MGSTPVYGLGYPDAGTTLLALPLETAFKNLATETEANAVGTAIGGTYWVDPVDGSDTNRGASQGLAWKTLRHALATAPAGSLIEYGTGIDTYTTPDAAGNGLTNQGVGTVVRGRSDGKSFVVLNTATYGWGLKAEAQQARFENLQVGFGAGSTTTWGVGVSTPTASGSVEHVRFKEVFVAIAAGATVAAAFAVGPDFAGSSAMDIAWTRFEDCAYLNQGTLGRGWLLGNGVQGNCVATHMRNCTGGGGQHAIDFAGCGAVILGGGFSGMSVSDFLISEPTGDNIILLGVRNENGVQWVVAGYVGGAGGRSMTLSQCSALNYTPPGSTRIIDYNMTGELIIVGGAIQTTTGTETIVINDSASGTQIGFTAIGLDTTNLNPYPARSPLNVSRTIIGATHNGVPIPAFQHVSDGTTHQDLAASTRGITSGALPTVAVVTATGAQVDAAADRQLIVPVTLNPTAGNTATVLVQLSPDNVTYSSVGTVTIPSNAGAWTGWIEEISLLVPAGWWVKLTATNATIGTGTFY